MKEIDFIGIGAQKSGTTWLHRRLSELQEFCLPPIKEIHYFDRSKKYPSPSQLADASLINRLINIKRTTKSISRVLHSIRQGNMNEVKWLYKYYYQNYNDDWYLSLFKDFKGITGEITPSYSILNEVDVKKMYNLLPNTKIIFLIRNPVDRAWSEYRYYVKLGKFNPSKTSENQIIEFLRSDDQELRSDYIRTINNYSKYFNNKQILVGFFDAIKEQPENLFKGILNFLAVETDKIQSDNNNLRIKNKISPKISMTKTVKEFLRDKYYQNIGELSNTFSGYCTEWHSDLYYNKTQKIKRQPESLNNSYVILD